MSDWNTQTVASASTVSALARPSHPSMAPGVEMRVSELYLANIILTPDWSLQMATAKALISL
jgi:hypothetical protein